MIKKLFRNQLIISSINRYTEKMNTRILFGTICICLICVFAAGCVESPVPEERETYVVGVSNMYMPFAYTDDNGTLTGFDVESVKWIAEEQGFDVTFRVIHSWPEYIPTLLDGKADMIYVGMTITPERLKLVDFSDPYWSVNQSIIVRKDSTYTMDDFYDGKLSLGVVEESTGDMWLREHFADYDERINDGRIKYYQTFMLALIGMQAGECNAVVFDDLSMKLFVPETPMKIIGVLDTHEEYGVAIRKSDTELLATMNEGLAKLKASPKWDELVVKYMGES